MKKNILLICGVAGLITISTAFANNFVIKNHNNNMNRNTSNSTSLTISSSGYQYGKINLNGANLSQPHVLTIETSANKLSGNITFNGKAVKNLTNQTTKIDLSPYLSVGDHKLEVSANYAPVNSEIKVELNAPNSNVTQQTNGDGVFNYQLEVLVR